MSDPRQYLTQEELEIWHSEISRISQNNIFCHCQTCQAQWVSSSAAIVCLKCGSHRVESIACWQFPDD